MEKLFSKVNFDQVYIILNYQYINIILNRTRNQIVTKDHNLISKRPESVKVKKKTNWTLKFSRRKNRTHVS